MKVGPSVGVVLALGTDEAIPKDAAQVLKTQIFLYEADTDRLKEAYEVGNPIVADLLESYSDAEFFAKLPDLDEEAKAVTYVAAEGDIATIFSRPAIGCIPVLTVSFTANARSPKRPKERSKPSNSGTPTDASCRSHRDMPCPVGTAKRSLRALGVRSPFAPSVS